jgi:exonuclease III
MASVYEDDDDEASHSPTFMTSTCNYIDESVLCNFLTNTANKLVKPFSVLHINCRSIVKNFNSLLDLLHLSKIQPSVIAVTETWLSGFNEHLYDIPGYSFVCISRDHKKGGGVGLYIDEKLNYKRLNNITYIKDSIESIFVELRFGKCSCNIVLGCVYRPPNTIHDVFINDLNGILDTINTGKHNNNIILTGDFNIDLLKTDDSTTKDLVNLLNVHMLRSIIDKPTRVASNSATLIDNFFTNCVRYSVSAGIILNDLSDHYPIIMRLELTGDNPSNVDVIRRDFSEANINNFLSSRHKRGPGAVCVISGIYGWRGEYLCMDTS